MAFGFEPGIKSFFERRQPFFQNMNIEGSYRERIGELKTQMKANSPDKPEVVILGGGPAGLMRAIQSLANGNPTTVYEKREAEALGRENTVALTEVTIHMLKYCGIYQYLQENRLIYPPNKGHYISVRLTDLEKAFKTVLKDLTDDPIIHYGSKVIAVDSTKEKLELIIESVDGQKSRIGQIDILVNAEGSRSTTNALLNIKRVEVLPEVPVIATLFKDRRPKIRGLGSFFKYVGKSVVYLARTIHYHTQFLFKFLLSKKFRGEFRGALTLKTPGQTYLGSGLSDKVNQKIFNLKEAVEKKEQVLKSATTEKEIKICKKELKRAEKKYRSFVKRWINMSLCFSNAISLGAKIIGDKSLYLYRSGHKSLHKFELVKIGADRADAFCKKINKTSVLLAGDACATVDPVTALGGNGAIQSSTAYLDFIWDYDTGKPQDKLLESYHEAQKETVDYVHKSSKQAREMYL